MKGLQRIGLGILTSVGGYLEAGSLGTALQAGGTFRFGLLWPLALGTICIALLVEMTGRLAAVSGHTLVDAIRERFGFSFHVWPFAAQLVVDVLVLASEIGGASLALQLATGVPMQAWTAPVAFGLWLLLWRGRFSAIENGMATLGLVTLCFVLAAWKLSPPWGEVARGLLPAPHAEDRSAYAYLAVAILGATISPSLATFYASGAVEEQWSTENLRSNRAVAGVGMLFGGLVSAAVMIVAAAVLAPRGIQAHSFQEAAAVLTMTFGRTGFFLFCASLGIGCFGAALELSLDVSYLVAQTFGWNWGQSIAPAEEARFPLVYTSAIAIASMPSFAGIDPLKLTMISMVMTVLALPFVIAPLVLLTNDPAYLREHVNGRAANAAVVTIVAIAVALALLAIPAQVLGG